MDDEIEGNHWGGAPEDTTETSDETTVEPAESPQKPQYKSWGRKIVTVLLAGGLIMVFITGPFSGFMFGNDTFVQQNQDPSVVVEKDAGENAIIVSVTDIPADYEYVTVNGPGKEARVVQSRTIRFTNPPDNAKITVVGQHETGMYDSETESQLVYSAEITLNGEE